MELNKLLLSRFNNSTHNACFIDNNKVYTTIEFRDLVSYIRIIFKTNKINKGDRIMFACKKDIISIAGIYSCLLDGIVFAPIDDHCPEERMKYIINDLNPQAIFCDVENAQKIDSCLLAYSQIKLIAHEEIIANAPVECKNEFNVNNIDEKSFAYILYTSGSTGTPKGVVVNRFSLCSFIKSSIDRAGYNSDTIFLNFFQLHFDPVLMEILVPWITGGICIIYNNSIFINDLIKTLQKYRVTDFSCTPNIISQFVGRISRFSKYQWDFLRSIWFGGECANIRDLKIFHQLAKNVILFNGYGPTETVIACSLHELEDKDYDSEILPIGTPISENVKFLILDNKLKRINKNGIQGELYVGGDQIMDGYWGQLDESDKVFITNNSCKYYPTGDIVFKQDDVYYFVGRKNAMLKIRGYRIYPAEIENAINRIKYVTNSIVFSSNDNLCAAVEVNSEDANLEVRIKDSLRDYLQTYMIPQFIYIYKKFPRLTNGKIDLLKIYNNG